MSMIDPVRPGTDVLISRFLISIFLVIANQFTGCSIIESVAEDVRLGKVHDCHMYFSDRPTLQLASQLRVHFSYFAIETNIVTLH